MKLSEFKLNRLDDFAAGKEKEAKGDLLLTTPFGVSREGNWGNTWQMIYNRIGMFYRSAGKNIFGNDDMTLITVPATETGIHPLADDQPFAWNGKINEYTAEMAVCRAFELMSDRDTSEFLKINKPVVVFSYLDCDGPGEISVKYNGNFWQITG